MTADMSVYMLFVKTQDPAKDRPNRHSSDHASASAAREKWAQVRAVIPHGHRIVEALILPPGARKGDPRVIDLLAT